MAKNLGFGPAIQFGEILYALVGFTAAAAIWWRWKAECLWWRREEFPE
jgi:hypothetical protein